MTIGSNAQNTIPGHFISGICWRGVYRMPLADTSNKMTKDSNLCVTSTGSNMIERVSGLTGWLTSNQMNPLNLNLLHAFICD